MGGLFRCLWFKFDSIWVQNGEAEGFKFCFFYWSYLDNLLVTLKYWCFACASIDIKGWTFWKLIFDICMLIKTWSVSRPWSHKLVIWNIFTCDWVFWYRTCTNSIKYRCIVCLGAIPKFRFWCGDYGFRFTEKKTKLEWLHFNFSFFLHDFVLFNWKPK